MELVIDSNDGWQKVVFQKNNEFWIDGTSQIILEISFSSKSWDKKTMSTDNFYELIGDKEVKFFQIIVDKYRWLSFLDKVDKWTSEGVLFTEELNESIGEAFKCQLLESSDLLIASDSKPVLCIIIKDSRTKFEYNMIVDRTSFVKKDISFN